MGSKRGSLLAASALALGLTLGLLCLLGGTDIQSATVYAGAGDVYCVTPGGGAYAACTQVFTHVQTAVDASIGGEEIRVATGTYTGVRNVPGLSTDSFTATQVLVITKSVTIRGGYTTADWITPHPGVNLTTLDAQGLGRALYVIGEISPVIEGLRITGGDATRLGGDAWGFDGGGGVYIDGTAATISGCVIVDNVASTARAASGGGLYLSVSDATLTGNRVTSNTASTGAGGSGGGLCLRGVSYPIVSGNTVTGNTASTSGTGHGGGVCLRFSNATLSGNTVVSNTASTSGTGYGGGLFVRRRSPTLSGNTVRGNVASTAHTGWGGGVRAELCNITLINNLIADNQAATHGSGLSFWGSSADPTSGQLLHNTIARSGAGDDSGEGVYVGQHATLSFTNTIIAGHPGVGITTTAGSTVTLEATLWHDNGASTGGDGAISTGAVNVFGDPRFVDPAAGDYHLMPGSAAIDSGVDAGVTEDLDGRTRPLGRPDLGAYEGGTLVHLPLLFRRYGR